MVLGTGYRGSGGMQEIRSCVLENERRLELAGTKEYGLPPAPDICFWGLSLLSTEMFVCDVLPISTCCLPGSNGSQVGACPHHSSCSQHTRPH